MGTCFGVAAAGFGAYGAVALDEEGRGAIALGQLARDGKTDGAGSNDLRAESSRQRSRRHGAAWRTKMLTTCVKSALRAGDEEKAR